MFENIFLHSTLDCQCQSHISLTKTQKKIVKYNQHLQSTCNWKSQNVYYFIKNPNAVILKWNSWWKSTSIEYLNKGLNWFGGIMMTQRELQQKKVVHHQSKWFGIASARSHEYGFSLWTRWLFFLFFSFWIEYEMFVYA